MITWLPQARNAQSLLRIEVERRNFGAGCNINRPIDRIVADAGFALTSLDRFRAKGPGVLAAMYRGVAERS